MPAASVVLCSESRPLSCVEYWQLPLVNSCNVRTRSEPDLKSMIDSTRTTGSSRSGYQDDIYTTVYLELELVTLIIKHKHVSTMILFGNVSLVGANSAFF